MKNLFNSLLITPIQRFVFQDRPEKEVGSAEASRGQEKQAILNESNKERADIPRPVRVSALAEEYMEGNDITIKPTGSMSFNKKVEGKEASGIPYDRLSLGAGGAMNVYVLQNRLLIFIKKELPQKPIAYKTSIIWYDAVNDKVIYMTEKATEASIVVDGKVKIYKDYLFDLVRNQD